MSPTTALLIGRETVNSCSHQLLTTIVERLLSSRTTTTNTGDTHRTEPYSLVITRKHELTITRQPNAHLNINNKNLAADEGFESDIDNASLLSSDGDSVNCFVDQKLQTHNSNSDSANSSSASDSSDTETTIKQQQLLQQQQQSPKPVEHFCLDNLVCYTNIRFPKIIGFVHKERTTSNGERSVIHEFLIFEFSSVENYDRIRYAFNSLSNAAINKNIQGNKFNLVQRTDKNGVTHIEISRDTNNLLQHQQQHNLNNLTSNHNSQQPSSIISINTPEINTQSDRNLLFDFQISNLSKLRSNSHGDLLNHTQSETTRLSTAPSICATTNLIDQIKARSNSNILDDLTAQARRHEIDGVIRADIDTENIIDTKKIKTLNINLHKNSDESVVLKKVWHSAEDILDDNSAKSNNITSNIDSEQPKKPERRRKQKGRAPPPPNVMKGQYVRVNVDPNKKTEPSQQKPQNTTVVTPQSNLKLASFEMNKLDNYNSNWVYVATSQPSSLVLTTVVTPELNDGPRLTNSNTYESFKNHHQTSSSEFRTDLLDHHRAASSRYPSISSSASTTATTTLNRRNREMLIKNSDRFHNNNNSTSHNNTSSSNKWTNSVPRIPKKIVPPPLRSRSENRYQKNNNPYKYVDTTTTNGIPLIFTNNSTNQQQHQQRNSMHLHASLPTVNNNLTSTSHTNTISNRLFGLSQKLKEFGTNVVSNSNHSNHHHHHSNRFLNNYDHTITGQSMLINNSTSNNNNSLAAATATLSSKRRSSLGELNYKSNVANLNSRYGTTTQPTTGNINTNTNNINLTNSSISNSNNSSGANSNSNLKSVIKKNSGNDHERNKTKNNNEKKVTFSAFATVQVV